MVANLGNSVSQSNPTPFTTTTGVDLSFDNPLASAKLLRDGNGFLNTKTYTTFWERHTILPKNIFGLIFMDFHCLSTLILIF
jgi:hypothetical protein